MPYNAIFFTEQTDSVAGALPPLGAYKCAHVLRRAGYSCLVVNRFGWYNMVELKALLDQAIDHDTRLVAFSTTFLQKKIGTVRGFVYESLTNHEVFPQGKDFENEIIAYCKSLNPKIKFGAGGSKVNANWQNKNIDYAMIGFSETSVVNLMHHLSQGTALTDSQRNVWGVTVIDDRLAPHYDFVHDRMRWLPEDVVNITALPIEIGRGCIFRCKFCAYPLNGKKNLDFVKSTDLLQQEFEENYRLYGIRDYSIVDDTFNDHVEKLRGLSNMIQKLSFQPRFWGYNRLDLICTHPETLPMLHDIGMRAFYFGIETLDLRAGRTIGKGFNRTKQIQMLETIHTNYPDMVTHGSFIAGLPGESFQSMQHTYGMLLKKQIPLHSWDIRALRIYKVNSYPSDIDKHWQEYGYVDQGHDRIFDKSLPANLLNWSNDFTNFEQASVLANEVMAQSKNSGIIHLPGQTALAASAVGKIDFEDLSHTLMNKINFNLLENQFFDNLKEYKTKLLQIVANKQSSHVADTTLSWSQKYL